MVVLCEVSGGVFVRVSIRDITERHAAVELFRSTFEDAPNGVALVAPDGSWLRVNSALCEMLRMDRSQVFETSIQSLSHPDDEHMDTELLGSLRAGRLSRYTVERRYLCGDGTVLDARLDVSLVRDAAGAPGHFVPPLGGIGDATRARRAVVRPGAPRRR